MVDVISRVHRSYLDNVNYVYKSCQQQWIVVLEKLDDTITNENRISVVDEKYAKYRANKLKVIKIFNKFDPSITIQKITNSVYDKSIEYHENKLVIERDFDTDINNVCSAGIHYFKSIEAAYYYEISMKKNYSGKIISWYDNGSKMSEGYIDYGIKRGRWTYWYEQQCKKDVPIIHKRGEYKNNREYDKWTCYYNVSGQIKKYEGKIVNGKKEGGWTYWDISGMKTSQGFYLNDIKEKLWSYWTNGQFYMIDHSKPKIETSE